LKTILIHDIYMHKEKTVNLINAYVRKRLMYETKSKKTQYYYLCVSKGTETT
jgi:hypothetical protein